MLTWNNNSKKNCGGQRAIFSPFKNDECSYPADQVKKQFQVYQLKKG